MIDPTIALRVEHPTPDDPLTGALRAQSLRDMQSQNQLQQQQIQQGQRQLDTESAYNRAIAQNTKTAPDGSMYVDHDAVIKSLADAGKGQAAMAYQGQVASMRKASLDMQKEQDAANFAKIQHAGSLLSTVLDADPKAQPLLYPLVKQQAINAGYVKPGELPDLWDDNTKAILGARRDQAISVEDQYKNKLGQERIDTYKTLAEARKAQADAANARAQAAQDKANQDDWQYLGLSGGRAKLFNKRTADTKDAGTLDEQQSGSGKDRQVTPDALLSDRRANQKDYETQSAAEIRAAQERAALQTALSKGNIYVDGSGKVTPFSSMKDGQGQPLAPEDTDALRTEMKQRLAMAQQSIETAVANKNNAMQRNGVQPSVSTADAISNYRNGGKSQPAGQPATTAPKQQGQQPTDVSDKPVTSAQAAYSKGQSVTVGGKRYTITGFRRNGNLVLTP